MFPIICKFVIWSPALQILLWHLPPNRWRGLKGGILLISGEITAVRQTRGDRRFHPELVVTSEGRNKKFKMRNLGANRRAGCLLQRRVLKSQLMSKFWHPRSETWLRFVTSHAVMSGWVWWCSEDQTELQELLPLWLTGEDLRLVIIFWCWAP